MTTLTLSDRWSRAVVITNPLGFLFAVLVRRLRRRLRIRADRHRLLAMPDSLLADIGISRGEIDSATEFGRIRNLPPSYRL